MADKHTPEHLDNAWITIDTADDPDFFIHFLDATRAQALAFAKSNPQEAFAHLNLADGQNILDCGCGTGDMLALMAGQIGNGRAVGIELSQVMLDEARKRTANGPANLSFEKMDSQSLSFSDAGFEQVMATQLLVHVPDPKKAFDEMCRVTVSGGRITLADIDWDTLVLGCSDVELGRRFTRLFSDGIRNGTIVREYPGWFKVAGFSNIAIIPQPIVFDQWNLLKQWILEPSLGRFVANHDMTATEAEKLMEDLSVRAQAGSTFSGLTLYTVVAEKG